MFKLTPETFTVKDVARALKLTPRAVQKSITEKGQIRNVKVPRRKGMIRITSEQFYRIIA